MIKKVGNVLLLGTSHVAKQSAKEIKEAILEHKPDVVAIELDYLRFKKLMKTNFKEKPDHFRMLKEFGVAGYLFLAVGGYVQKKIGKNLGIEPGIDMKTAYLVARDNKIPTALIDQDIRLVMKKLKRVPFFKKISMFSNLIFKSFKKEYRKKLNFDVKKGVPDDEYIEAALDILKKEVRVLYDILIHDRNKFMVEKIAKLKENHDGLILVVVGAGHVAGMEELLQVSRVRDLGYGKPGDVTLSFNLNVD